MWSDLTKFRHFGKMLKVAGIFLRAYLVWTYFVKNVLPLGKFSLLQMTKYEKIFSSFGHMLDNKMVLSNSRFKL